MPPDIAHTEIITSLLDRLSCVLLPGEAAGRSLDADMVPAECCKPKQPNDCPPYELTGTALFPSASSSSLLLDSNLTAGSSFAAHRSKAARLLLVAALTLLVLLAAAGP